MATNPRIPEDDARRQRRLESVPVRKRPSGGFNGLLIALAAFVVILGILIYYLPRSPKMTRPSSGATVPAQATGDMLQVQDLQLSVDPTGKSLRLQGKLNNNGTQTVTGAMAHVQFFGTDGANAGSADVPVQTVQVNGKGANAKPGATQSLTEAPLKPNDSRVFQLEVTDLPANWNHQMPQLSFTQVASHP